MLMLSYVAQAISSLHTFHPTISVLLVVELNALNGSYKTTQLEFSRTKLAFVIIVPQ
jgi:hypothetical protein